MFITKKDLYDLTGYKLPGKQIKWLHKNGIRFMQNRYGHPLVLEKQLDAILIDSAKPKARTEPDEAALMKAMARKA